MKTILFSVIYIPLSLALSLGERGCPPKRNFMSQRIMLCATSSENNHLVVC